MQMQFVDEFRRTCYVWRWLVPMATGYRCCNVVISDAVHIISQRHCAI